MAKTPRINDIISPAPVTLSSGAIDVSLGSVFSLSTAGAQTLSFTNFTTGKIIVVIVNNTSASQITLTVPTLIKDSNFTANVTANKRNVYTFINVGGSIYATNVTDLA